MQTFLYYYWALTTLAALFAVAVMMWLAWGERRSALWWRGAKLFSAFFGGIGVILFVLNTEKMLRDSMVTTSNNYAFELFLEAKLRVTHEMALACSGVLATQDAENNCYDVRNINGILSFAAFHSDRKFGAIRNWQHNPALEPLLTYLNQQLRSIDDAELRKEKENISAETRINLTLLATILLIAATAGTIGEATYQFRQTVRVEKALLT